MAILISALWRAVTTATAASSAPFCEEKTLHCDPSHIVFRVLVTKAWWCTVEDMVLVNMLGPHCSLLRPSQKQVLCLPENLEYHPPPHTHTFLLHSPQQLAGMIPKEKTESKVVALFELLGRVGETESGGQAHPLLTLPRNICTYVPCSPVSQLSCLPPDSAKPLSCPQRLKSGFLEENMVPPFLDRGAGSAQDGAPHSTSQAKEDDPHQLPCRDPVYVYPRPLNVTSLPWFPTVPWLSLPSSCWHVPPGVSAHTATLRACPASGCALAPLSPSGTEHFLPCFGICPVLCRPCLGTLRGDPSHCLSLAPLPCWRSRKGQSQRPSLGCTMAPSRSDWRLPPRPSSRAFASPPPRGGVQSSNFAASFLDWFS